MSLAALVLAVGTLALIAYVLLLIVGLSVVGAILEALSSLDGDLGRGVSSCGTALLSSLGG